MPVFPYATLDDVEGAAQRSFSDGKDMFRAALLRQNAGDQAATEQFRSNSGNVAAAVNSVVVQSLIGQDSTLAAQTLGDRFVRDQPQTVGNSVDTGATPGKVNGTATA